MTENLAASQIIDNNNSQLEVIENTVNFDEFIGKSSGLLKVLKTIEKVSRTDSTVLISGESGTGKELVARSIQSNSKRRNSPMVVLNCGAIPSELLESELFGHEKGAFTGAHRTRTGRLEIAHKGTIFLDEIGDMSPDLQVKLLRALQEQCFERVGSTKTIQVDVRIISATNKNLQDSILKGTFREDLFYRLNVIPINIPPLRERKNDIKLLSDYFLKKLSERLMEPLKKFSPEVSTIIENYKWPGNIRELENLMERLAVLVEGETINVEDLPQKIIEKISVNEQQDQSLSFNPDVGFNESVENHQKQLIVNALKQTNWVKAKAAELLKMKRTTLVEKIKKMNIEPEKNYKKSSKIDNSLFS